MTTDGWWILVGLALLVGAAAGGWLTWRIARMRHAVQLRKVNGELQRKFLGTIDQLRAAQVRAQTELEQARNAAKRQLAASDAPRAAAARAEERLRAAQIEMDQMRRAKPRPDTEREELTDGFAATRPMYDRL
ncbi:MAG TPA: hypothetical protein VFA35_11340 [Burkholderiaceae bacterium]|nr:hypothetical protein [Burkholderiaceae bacterium]